MKFKLTKTTLFFIILGVLLLTHLTFNVREYFTDGGGVSGNSASSDTKLIQLNPENYYISGKGITANGGMIPVNDIKTEGEKYVFLAKDGDYTLVIKSTDIQDDSTGYYYIGDVSEYGSKNLTELGNDLKLNYSVSATTETGKDSTSDPGNSTSPMDDPLAKTGVDINSNTNYDIDNGNDVTSTNMPITTPSISTIGQSGSSDTPNGNPPTRYNADGFKPSLSDDNDDVLNMTQMGRGIPRSLIPPGDEDLYILKSEIVPPVCPKCPDVTVCPKGDNAKCPPCPPCARCPEPSFECKKVPNYNRKDDTYLPRPVLSDFSQFGM